MNQDRWLRTSGAVNELSISRATLLRRKKDGYFKQGQHWITSGPFERSPVLWNVDQIREVMGHWNGPASVSGAQG